MKIIKKDNNDVLDLKNKKGLDFSGSSFITHSYEETEKLGYDFAQSLKKGDVISLTGDLGSGKTTFTKGLAKGLGIDKRIISPTFVLVRHYISKIEKPKSGVKNLYHIDLYRLGDEDIKGVGLKEIMNSEDAVTVIEWPENAEHILPENTWEIRFTLVDEDKREIKIEKR